MSHRPSFIRCQAYALGLIATLGSASALAATTWVQAVQERESFTLGSAATVRYGLGTVWVDKALPAGSLVACESSTFGRDPVPGQRKACLVPRGTWKVLVQEGSAFTQSPIRPVRYGLNSSWVQRDVNGAAQCSNAFFGKDPLNGTRKRCEVAVLSPVVVTEAPPPPAPVRTTWIDPTTTRVALAGGSQIELFVNGVLQGSAQSGAKLSQLVAKSLVVGDNVIALRVKRGSASPALFAEISGEFGRVASSASWRAKAATSAELTSTTWAKASTSDSAWPVAIAKDQSLPSGWAADSAAQAMWPSDAGAATALFRLKLYVPDVKADTALGLAKGVTGGAGGERVRVTTPEQLKRELCRSYSGGVCSDAAPRIIEVASTIDFRGTEGQNSGTGCYHKVCPSPMKSERIFMGNPTLTHCNGKPTFTMQLDKAGQSAMQVGANKTLVGIGPDAAIKGKGLLIRGGVSNVIVRNLSFTDINEGIVFGGDAIRIDKASKVWIDHNRFARIGRQMIVTGKEPAQNVTVSWNEFDGRSQISAGCDGHHYWNLLVIGSDDSLTLAHNWLRATSGRAPKIGTTSGTVLAQVVNNYFDDNTGHALDNQPSGRILMEGNHFDSVRTPIQRGASYGLLFAPMDGSLTAGTQAQCQQTLGRACVGNTVDKPGSANFVQDSAALAAFKGKPVTRAFPAEAVPRYVPLLAGPGKI